MSKNPKFYARRGALGVFSSDSDSLGDVNPAKNPRQSHRKLRNDALEIPETSGVHLAGKDRMVVHFRSGESQVGMVRSISVAEKNDAVLLEFHNGLEGFPPEDPRADLAAPSVVFLFHSIGQIQFFLDGVVKLLHVAIVHGKGLPGILPPPCPRKKRTPTK